MQPDFPIEANLNVTSKVKLVKLVRLVRLVKTSPGSSTIPFFSFDAHWSHPHDGLTSVLRLGKNLILSQFAFRSNEIGGSGLICFRHHFKPRICGSKKVICYVFIPRRTESLRCNGATKYLGKKAWYR